MADRQHRLRAQVGLRERRAAVVGRAAAVDLVQREGDLVVTALRRAAAAAAAALAAAAREPRRLARPLGVGAVGRPTRGAAAVHRAAIPARSALLGRRALAIAIAVAVAVAMATAAAGLAGGVGGVGASAPASASSSAAAAFPAAALVWRANCGKTLSTIDCSVRSVRTRSVGLAPRP